ncbi:unnamed protein product [Prorocentrum cordatum]|uniref:Guanine nucleotide-binding protein subunit beta-like protein n=1 Tax=Prorocentrum cordatum TaxID=2364126 RepID=A0ABN9P698_9DINO|nr:unnamed protein product [Polarella glacialis]
MMRWTAALTGSTSGTLRLWDLTGRDEEPLVSPEGHAASVTCVSVDWESKRAVTGSADRALRSWDLDELECIGTLQGHDGWIWSVDVDWQGGSGAVSASDDRTLRLWSMSAFCLLPAAVLRQVEADTDQASSDATCVQCEKSMAVQGGWAMHVVVNWNLQQALCACSNRTLELWDLQTGSQVAVLSGHASAVKCVGADWGRRQALSGSSDGAIKLWNLRTAECLLTLDGHAEPVRCLAFDPKSQRALSGSEDCLLKLWDTTSGQCIVTLNGHADSIECMRVDWAGQTVISGSRDGELKVWSLSLRTCTSTFQHATGVASCDAGYLCRDV